MSLMSLLFAAVLVGPPAPTALVLAGVTVYTSPDEWHPLYNQSVLITDSTIADVGPSVSIPAGATVIHCDGCVVMAGFWNAHVHLAEPMFAVGQPADTLAADLRAMLTRYGFTTVIDLGSNPANTVPLRQRIAAGEIAGPRILTAGTPLYPPNGIPFYLSSLPPDALAFMRANQTPATRAAAIARVDADVDAGADVVKLFTGSWVRHGTVLPMPDSVARAAVQEAHKRHRLVFSHCSNIVGARVALDAGVDVMAHTLDDTAGVDSALFRTMVTHRMSLIPTLSLFADTPEINAIVHEVTIFRSYGGELLFGTDVGFTHEFDTTREYQLLGQAGLDVRDVLRMLTTAPAYRMGQDKRRGRVERGMVADLTVLASDPKTDLTAFARVRYTIRGGAVIFSRPAD
jgi:imidazolonepropionase-like amidohydrolase